MDLDLKNNKEKICVMVTEDYTNFDSDKEKTDVTPENKEKTDDVICSSSNFNHNHKYGNEASNNNLINLNNNATTFNNKIDDETIETGVALNEELKIVEDESSNLAHQQCLAFTIDFSNNSDNGGNDTSAKYKTMLERFQNRHRRGSSMSTLDNNDESNNKSLFSPNSSNSKTPRIMSAQTSRDSRISSNETEAGKVKLRIRERSMSGIRDSSKRHSWSPRSSAIESNLNNYAQQQQQQQLLQPIKPSPYSHKIKMKAENLNENKAKQIPTPTAKIISNSTGSNTNTKRNTSTSDFCPRSTAMQMALEKIDFLCLQPPLDNNYNDKENFIGNTEDDAVSEAGTYTLDGDNYTEEQKDLMNIDKTNYSSTEDILSNDDHNEFPTTTKFKSTNNLKPERPKDFSIYSLTPKSQDNKPKNVLEVNYYHDATNLKPKISYLDKIKSRVKNFAKSPDKIDKQQHQHKMLSSNDKGTFTSITTSGILSKKLSLDPNPKIHRKNSLTTSQIDSSEYIGGSYQKNNQNNSSPYSSGVFTDHQKAEYRMLTKKTDIECDNEDIVETSDSQKTDLSNLTDTAGIKTAQSKSDWIQEWARNARARSVSVTNKTPNSTSNGLMTRSYNCEAADEICSELSEPYCGQPQHSSGDFMYQHHPHDYNFYANGHITDCKDRKKSMSELILSGRPPVSPSKIPSPMHSVGRSRNISKTRSSLQDLSPSLQCGDTDIYLQKTAAAISNLTQNFSRKNSVRSLNAINSPRRQLYNKQQNFQNDFLNNPDNLVIGQKLHKRNLSLDFPLQQQQQQQQQQQNNLTKNFINSNLSVNNKNDYRLPRSRINSFDSNSYAQQQLQYGSPKAQPITKLSNQYIDQTLQSTKQNQNNSPIRRSSSFSTKIHTSGNLGRVIHSQAIKNPSTPPSTRYHNSGSNQSTPNNGIQKSASSNSFRKMYNEYDMNVSYYINDEDDLDYCSSEEFYEDDEIKRQQQSEQTSAPLTNTRYNKALLMRIEKSKEKMLGGGSNVKPAPGGVMACPNTPEMPRRAIQQQHQRASVRQSVPRDSSLNRLKNEVPNSLDSAKKQLLQTAAKAQPRYLDISKYKQQNNGNFLKKNESKITLKNDITQAANKRSSSASINLSRNDPTRCSNRSIKSTTTSRPNSAIARRDQSATKQKELELAMWKRRATYDPMKAAAEDRKKKDEAKKLIKSTDSPSSSVLRSQSFHYGIGNGAMTPATPGNFDFVRRRNSQNYEHDNDDDDDDGDGRRNNQRCWSQSSSDEAEIETFISSSTTTTTN